MGVAGVFDMHCVFTDMIRGFPQVVVAVVLEVDFYPLDSDFTAIITCFRARRTTIRIGAFRPKKLMNIGGLINPETPVSF